MATMALLTPAQVAELQRVPLSDLQAEILAGRVGVPTEFAAVGRRETSPEPRWAPEDVEPRPLPEGHTRLSGGVWMDLLYDETVLHVLTHGHARIKQSELGRTRPNGKPFPLGVKVSALRIAYSRGKLAPAVVQRFQKLPGWAWDATEADWRQRFAEVVAHWPDRWVHADRAWLTNQRQRWEMLRPEWREMLASIPGLIEPIEKSKVDQFVAAVQAWMAETGVKNAAAVPYSATVQLPGESEPVKLGRRVTYYRRRYRGKEGKGGNVLTPEEIARIETLPGWTWEPSRPHQRMKADQPHPTSTDRADPSD